MKYRPMADSLILTALISLLVFGILTLNGTIPLSWGFTFILLSVIYIIASVVSLTPDE
ncbi:MAG: hypothetical protein ACMXYA_01375 [Candidatus Woesearchaeota archaeon]